jgi:hypothetical protein
MLYRQRAAATPAVEPASYTPADAELTAAKRKAGAAALYSVAFQRERCRAPSRYICQRVPAAHRHAEAEMNGSGREGIEARGRNRAAAGIVQEEKHSTPRMP